MATIFGLTPQGFVAPSLADIRTRINGNIQALTGINSVGLTDNALLGQLIGIFANEFLSLWDLAQAVYAAQDPDAATFTSLRAIGAISGCLPLPPIPSSVTITLTGANGTVIASGWTGSTRSTSIPFVTTATATLATVPAWAQSTPYIAGAAPSRVSANGNVYQCVTAGTSSSTGTGPSTTAESIPDGVGALTWAYVGQGLAAMDAPASSVANGPIVAAIYDLTVIGNPISGLSGVNNMAAATPGRLDETDGAFRLRRVQELSSGGNATKNAIRANVLETLGVLAATIFVNSGDTADANSQAPHSIDALVTAATGSAFDIAIANTILNSVAAGIDTVGSGSGSTTVSVPDSQGVLQSITFTRPTLVVPFMTINVSVDALAFPSDGNAEIAADVVTWGATLATGRDVVSSSVAAQSFQTAGVLDSHAIVSLSAIPGSISGWTTSHAYVAGGTPSYVTNFGRTYVCAQAGTSASGGNGPTSFGSVITDGTAKWVCCSDPIAISLFQIASIQLANITVNSTPITP